MAYLMLAILIAFLILAYYAGKRNLLSPWFLLCLAVLASYVIVLCNTSNWEVQISGIFILYVSTALLAFGCGMLIIKLFGNTKKSANSYVAFKSAALFDIKPNSKRYPVNVLFIVSLLLSCAYVFKLFLDVGFSSSISATINAIYNKIVHEDYSPGFVFNQIREIVTAIAYISWFRLMQNIFTIKSHKKVVRTILPILFFLLVTVIYSDRNIFLRFAIYAICMYVIFFQRKSKNIRHVNRDIIIRVIILLIVMIIIFFIMGKAKQYTSDFTRAIGIYGGSGLYNFNLWLQKADGQLYYGASTFSVFIGTLNSILSPLGISFQSAGTIARFDELIVFASSNGYVYSSNIYSSMFPYVEDFGYFGVILFPFIMGAFYGFLFKHANNRNNAYSWIIYSLLIYSIVFFPIAEQFIRRFHLGYVYEFFWCTIVYLFAYGRKRRAFVKTQKTVVVPQGEENKCKKFPTLP